VFRNEEEYAPSQVLIACMTHAISALATAFSEH